MTDSPRQLAGHVDRMASFGETDRKVSWIFSDENVALDFHTIRTAGWDLDDYLRNPVLLFAHDQDQPPIGRVTRIEKRGALLVGDSEFADEQTYPFADTIFRLVKGGFLNAVSVSWFPLEAKAARDRARPDGIDFLRQKLLEISVVPVPANPGALVTARSFGIDTRPLNQWAQRALDVTTANARDARIEQIYRETRMPTSTKAITSANWKCCASRNLPINGAAAVDTEALFALCKFDSDKPDLGKLRKAFLIVDDAAPRERASYRHPIACVVDDRLCVSPRLLRAARAELAKADYPEAVAEQAIAALTDYARKLVPVVIKVSKRGLYEVQALASLLSSAGWIKSEVDYEEGAEGDTDSTGPANMLAVLHALGKALVEMAQEEVDELLAQFGPMPTADGARAAPGHIALTRAGKKLSGDDRAALEAVHDHCARSHKMVRAHIDRCRDAGMYEDSALSDEAEACHDHCVASARRVRDYIDGQAPPTSDNNEPITGRAAPQPAPAADASAVIASTPEERRKRAAELQAQNLIERAKGG